MLLDGESRGDSPAGVLADTPDSASQLSPDIDRVAPRVLQPRATGWGSHRTLNERKGFVCLRKR